MFGTADLHASLHGGKLIQSAAVGQYRLAAVAQPRDQDTVRASGPEDASQTFDSSSRDTRSVAFSRAMFALVVNDYILTLR